jgi:thymidylate synthase
MKNAHRVFTVYLEKNRMQQYLNMLKTIMNNGSVRENRTGVDTKGVNFYHIPFDLEFGKSLPIVTTKRLAHKSVLGELLGFIRGLETAAGFRALDCKIWDANANTEGAQPNPWLQNPTRKGTDDLGRIYGAQWRNWEDTKIRPSADVTNAFYIKEGYEEAAQFLKDGKMYKVWTRRIDQLNHVINTLYHRPTDRRCIVSGWNPGELNEMSLPPCHLLQHYLCEKLSNEERLAAHITKYESIQIWESNTLEGVKDRVVKQFKAMNGSDEEKLNDLDAPKYRLDLVMYQRSVDSILGAPYNITSYGMMLHMMARMIGIVPGVLHYVTGDTHIYNNHFDAVQEQIKRTPVRENVRFIMKPSLETLKDFERAIPADFRVFNYQNLGPLNHPTPMAV